MWYDAPSDDIEWRTSSKNVTLEIVPAKAAWKAAYNKGGNETELVTKLFIRARESVVASTRGQTMTEYALILAAIAVVVYGTYRVLGNNIGSLASGVDSALTNA
jgi:Flp pilus assembly pilin Flp